MKHPFEVKDKLVCIVGGKGLIGTAVVRLFGEMGATVIIGSRNPDGQYKPIDIGNPLAIDAFIADVLDKHSKIDVWINAAWPRSTDKTRSQGPDVVKEVHDHLVGVYQSCEKIFAVMKEQRRGSIINLGSIYGERSPDPKIYEGTDIVPSPAYSLIKGGLHAYTKYLACQGASCGVRVNAVCPGGVLNDHSEKFQAQYAERVPFRRMAKPEEVAAPILFLASDAASYITGQLLFVDGGLTAW